jgi:hypothetical protein
MRNNLEYLGEKKKRSWKWQNNPMKALKIPERNWSCDLGLKGPRYLST